MIEPLLPRYERRFRHAGRQRIDERKTSQGISSVLARRKPARRGLDEQNRRD